MGLQIGDIVPRKQINFSDLKGKIIAVDAFNTIYQFLSTIRQPDGTPLMDKQGRVTSHLSGLFYRNINLLSEGLRLVYVFDGIAPEQKIKTHKARQEVKEIAKERYEKAKEEKDIEAMRRYSQQLTKLTEEMISESKSLLLAMGICVVQAPSEGEAQAAYIAKKGAYAVSSQDYDALLFGTPRLIQNLTLARKRRTPSGSFIYISPEIIELHRVLNSLQLTQDQLICLGILAGTDYNPKGIRGIGQKKALTIVRKYKQPALIFKSVSNLMEKQEEQFDWKEIFELFKKPNIDKEPDITCPKMNKEKIKEILLSHDFSEERVSNQLDKLDEVKEKGKQRTLF